MSREEERIKKILEVAEDPAGVLFDHIEEVDSKFEEIETKVEEVKTLVKDAVDNRINGKDGESIKGDKGDKGEKGDQGPKGDKGDNGKDGRDGLNGLDGKDGVDGKDGLDGEQGPKGDKGDTGKTPLHEWFGSSLRFELPDGKWGPWANLQGPAGQNRASSVARELIIKSGGSVVANDAQMIDFSGATVTRQGNGVLVTIPTTSPGGASGSVQYNNGGSFGGFGSYDSGTGVLTLSGNLNLGANILIGHSLRSDASDGVLIEAANGTDVGIFGVANTANSLFYGSVNINGNLTINTLSGVLKASAGLVSGSATTSDLPEGTNLYYTDARARSALSATSPVLYNSGTGVISFDTATTALTSYLKLDASNDPLTGTLTITPSSDVGALVLNEFAASPTSSIFQVKNSAGTTKWDFTKTILDTANAIGWNIIFETSSVVSPSTARTGLSILMSGGYTGSSKTAALAFENNCLSTGTGYTNDTSNYGYRANGPAVGVGGYSRGVMAGVQIALEGIAGGSASSAYGVWGAATRERTGGQAVGILGAARNTVGTAFAVAAVLGSRASKPITRSTSAALLADNGDQAVDVAAFQVAEVDVAKIDSSGSAWFFKSIQLPYVAKTANYTATVSDYTIDCTANTFTITLPTAVGITGRIYNIKNTGTGTITVDANGSETIDGELTMILSPGVSGAYPNLQIQSNGANWIIL